MAPEKHVLILSPILLAALLLIECASQATETREARPFFQPELETERHGKKTWLDQIIEIDPGRLKVETASDYMEHPPSVVAVLPFCDEGDANFTVDKIPVTFRNEEQKNQWAWTDSQRLRRSVVGYLAQREFTIVNPIAVDAVLRQQRIDKRAHQPATIEPAPPVIERFPDGASAPQIRKVRIASRTQLAD